VDTVQLFRSLELCCPQKNYEVSCWSLSPELCYSREFDDCFLFCGAHRPFQRPSLECQEALSSVELVLKGTVDVVLQECWSHENV
jgi:hypothetical protein